MTKAFSHLVGRPLLAGRRWYYFFLAAGFFLSAAWVSTEAARLRAGLDLEVLRTLLASFAILGEDFSFLAIM